MDAVIASVLLILLGTALCLGAILECRSLSRRPNVHAIPGAYAMRTYLSADAFAAGYRLAAAGILLRDVPVRFQSCGAVPLAAVWRYGQHVGAMHRRGETSAAAPVVPVLRPMPRQIES